MRNTFIMLKTRLIEIFYKKQLKVKLGRWTIEDCQKKTNSKIDNSNEDHCGSCGLYKKKDT